MPLYRDEGVVLRTVKLGEADRIITLLTRDHGKVRAVAKGARRTKSRFGARLEPFMRVDVLIAQGRSLDVISQAESLRAYAGHIVDDYDAYVAANVIVETVDKLISTEHERNATQYRLLIGALHALAMRAHDSRAVSASYVLRALGLAGWSPRLSRCVVCDGIKPVSYFSIASGGVMCEADHTPDARPISMDVVFQLDALLHGDWEAIDGRPLLATAEHIVEDWGEYYLERPLRAMRMMEA